MNDLRKNIETAINSASAENGSDTPDFILADYLTDCLTAYDKAVMAREKWYGRPELPKPFPSANVKNEARLAVALDAPCRTQKGTETKNEQILSDFEAWANQYPGAFDLTKTPAMRTENPYSKIETWKAYEAWCDSRIRYATPNTELKDGQ